MKVYVLNQEVFEDKDIVPCVQFALALHQSSNVKHVITVQEENAVEQEGTVVNKVRLTLIRE